jgi:pimeloyl-ACP methyl ester carboxylesterase
VNEHGTQDIPAMLDKIHGIKMDDLKDIKDDVLTENSVNGERLPYALCGVAHSLGGASILMYVVTRRLEHKPHHLSRLILLSPAGFHEHAPEVAKIMQYVVPWIAPFVGPLVPGLYIPTRFCRALFNKLVRDFQSYPAIGGLVQAILSLVVGGDSSNWVGAIGMSHYNMDDMPGMSFLVAQHLLQMLRAKRFVMFDFGSAQTNMEAYGTPEPLDIGAHYGVIDIPVDVVAGVKDYVIPRSMVKRHFDTLKTAGCAASYDEFEYAHLDFTFSHREELLAYVMSRLLLVTPPPLNTGVRELVPPAPTSFKTKSFKHKLNTLLSRKSSRKLKPGLEDQSSKHTEEDMSMTRYPNHDQDIVTAGSVSTDSHEESFREPRSTSHSEIDSLQWMTPRQGQYVMARPQEPDVTKIMELKHQHNYNAATITKKLKDDTFREHSSPKSNAFTKLASQLFRKNPSSNSTGRQLSKPHRSTSGLNLCTLSNCYAGPTMLDEDSDE